MDGAEPSRRKANSVSPDRGVVPGPRRIDRVGPSRTAVWLALFAFAPSVAAAVILLRSSLPLLVSTVFDLCCIIALAAGAATLVIDVWDRWKTSGHSWTMQHIEEERARCAFVERQRDIQPQVPPREVRRTVTVLGIAGLLGVTVYELAHHARRGGGGET